MHSCAKEYGDRGIIFEKNSGDMCKYGKMLKVLGAIEMLCTTFFSRNVTPHLVMLHNAGPYAFVILGPLALRTLE